MNASEAAPEQTVSKSEPEEILFRFWAELGGGEVINSLSSGVWNFCYEFATF